MNTRKKFVSLLLTIIIVMAPVSIVAQAASANEIRSKVVSVASAEVGYTGTGSYSKYGEWYGYQGAWCTTFALWVFNKAGDSMGLKLYSNIVPSGGNCNSMISWFKNRDRYYTRSSGYTPQKGDLIFFDWSGNGSSQHVGIVDYVSGSTVYTIEGNCSGKVKARKYTTSGSKPYNNISSIMGYGCPDYDGVAGTKPSKSTTKKKSTTKRTTTAKRTTTTTKKHTTQKPTKPASTKPHTSSTTTTTTTTTTQTTATTTTTTTTTTAPNIQAKDIELHASNTQLEIGDSAELKYSVKPANSTAVVGYFCDEENIIEISQGGKITAIGEGTATVVVCANDEIYKQVDFVVSEATADVTRQKTANDYVEQITSPSQITEKSGEQRLNEIGLNINMLKNNKQFYIIPLSIAGGTLLLSLSILAIKKIASIIRARKNRKEEE